jgi:hypothetical protein
MSPLQAGAVGAVPGVGVITLPHASFTTGGVGTTASAGQFTVVDPFDGSVKSGTLIVYVYVQLCEWPAQSV